MTRSFNALVDRLCEISRHVYSNPYQLEWPASVKPEDWCTSPELYERLPESQRSKLSFYEAINFFSLNINGEKSLVEGIARRMYSKRLSQATAYLHHFLDEENKHMVYFGTFCMKYAGRTYPEK